MNFKLSKVITKKSQFAFFSLTFLVSCSGEIAHEKFPGGAGKTSGVQQAQTTQAVLGGIDSLDNPLAGGDKRSQKSGPRIAGVVSLARGAEYKEGMSFFISARPLEGGAPLAVKRLGRVQFPYRFELTENDRMMAGTEFTGKVSLALRLDQDGNPLSREDGDLSVRVETEVGKTELKLVLSP